MKMADMRKFHLNLTCLNPACEKPMKVPLDWTADKEPQWSDIPVKMTVRCPSCGVTGEYHPRNTKHGKALPVH
jgi:hypothetical protein